MKKQITGVVIAVFVLGGLYLYSYAVSSVYRISAEEAKQRLRDKQIDIILDVRTAVERDTLGYYPGAVHIPSSELDRQMIQRFPNKSASILVYCNTGQRARAATEKLRALGYTDVHYIASSHRSLMV
jgi:rhodanese-related sulfurtransferase